MIILRPLEMMKFKLSSHWPSETDNDDSITVSFEFADGVVLIESFPISWNFGTIQFSQDVFLTNDSVQIRVIDSDLNLNPEIIVSFY